LKPEEFGARLAELLGSERTKGRRATLATAVVRRQLARAAALLESGERNAGLSAVRGALYVVKVGEVRPSMWQGADRALAEAAEEASRIGNEGRARALYSLVKQANPSASVVASANEHLAAMDQFAASTGAERSLERAGDAQRVAVERAIYEPTAANLEIASKKVTEWMAMSLVSDALERWGDASVDRLEAIEAYRARRFGALTLVAAHLRHGDSMGGLEWLEKSDLGSQMTAELRQRLELAGEEDDAMAWGQLYQLFQSEADPNRADSAIGSELAQAAAFGAAVELYRSHPTDLIAVGPIALLLPDFQLGDAVPHLLVGALGDRPGQEEISWALSLQMRALLAHGESGDVLATRAIFEQGRPILDRAEALLKRGEPVRPHPARLYRAMATIEARAAELERARSNLARSLQLEPTALGFVELARLERQGANPDAALAALAKARERSGSIEDALGATESATVKYEILVERGDVAGAERALREALDSAIGARDRAQRPIEQAQAERRLARVLELYGKDEAAERALKRALQASRTDAQQLSVTILDTGRRALVAGDLGAMRDVIRDAQQSRLRGEDCVYVALWLRALERRRDLPSDGTVEDLLGRLGELEYWPSKLRGWLLGQLTDAELQAAIRRETERVEYRFYQQLLGATLPPSNVALATLKEIASSRAAGLVEVSVAQDWVRKANAVAVPSWPAGMQVP
jgi:tetratricopeptide (TPR) repeat protein